MPPRIQGSEAPKSAVLAFEGIRSCKVLKITNMYSETSGQIDGRGGENERLINLHFHSALRHLLSSTGNCFFSLACEDLGVSLGPSKS